jgi:hypothetical protein
MKKPYCCEATRHVFDQYYTRQQNGGGDFPVYVGRLRQRGHGIGDIFRSIWRYFSPAVKTLAPHALRAGANIVEDVSSGKTWKDSAFKHVPSVVRQVPSAISSVVSARQSQSGSGFLRRRTAKRKRVTKRKKPKKRARRDIFY